MIILLAFLNDVPIMTIAYDRTSTSRRPVRWNMSQVLTISTVMGITGVIGSFGMLLLAREWLHLSIDQIQTYVFLKMAVAGHLILFVARSKGNFWQHPLPAPVMIWSAIITKIVGTLIAAYGFGMMTPISWWEIGLVWGYSIVSAVITDAVKVWVYGRLSHRGLHHLRFLKRLKHPLHLHGH
jgi:H+-transporting ATPase